MLNNLAPKYIWFMLALVVSALCTILYIWSANTAQSHRLLVHVVDETNEMQTVSNMRETTFIQAYKLYQAIEEFYHNGRPLEPEQYKHLEEKFRESKDLFLGSHLITDVESDSWAKAAVVLEQSFKLQTEVIDLHRQGEIQKADKKLAQEVLPVTNKALEALEEILNHQREEMREAVEESMATIESSKKFIVALSVLIITLSIITVIIARREQAMAVSRQQALQELEIAKEQAVAANKAKSDVLARTSHDLRTPLNVMIGYSELVRDELQDGRTTEVIPDVEKIIYTSKQLLSLINDILDLAKIEEGKMEIVPEEFLLDTLIADISEAAEQLKNDNKFTIAVATPSLALYTDPLRLRQIILNLLSNAFKFTCNGTVRLLIEHQPIEGQERISLTVSDTGTGMSEDQVATIFDAYRQADKHITKQYGGTGLGLAICRSLSELLGGKVTVQSQLGQGTTFNVDLPLRL
ncbi:MAG: ATP-binding protein [Gammaproteobacteria bacterium]|nr:ATP-binding protein [Gammaproteobacteria bacterium]